jgi:hypothetical protein
MNPEKGFPSFSVVADAAKRVPIEVGLVSHAAREALLIVLLPV